MTEPTRLFDCLEHQLTSNPSGIMFAAKEDGTWKEYTVQDVSDIVNRLSAGLLKLGIGGGDHSPEGRDKIALISKNRPEWLMLDLAVQKIGAVLTPVYPTISLNELEFVLSDAAVKIAFVSDNDLYEKVNGIKGNLPQLQDIYSFDEQTGTKHWMEILLLAND
ncbi:MAG: AMP-binding protein, partial [Panacibacter sp.]